MEVFLTEAQQCRVRFPFPLSWQMQNYLYLFLKNVVWNSGRELFLADASLFVDDAEAFDHYEREEEEIPSSQLSRPPEEV